MPVKLVYFEEFETKSEALHREIQLKKLTRQEKEVLIKKYTEKSSIFNKI